MVDRSTGWLRVLGARLRLAFFAVICLVGLAAVPARAEARADRFITLACTTSTENSGLLDAILPLFEGQSGVDVRVVAVGTGQALRLGQNGDADVVLVHDRASEDRFVADGWGVARYDVMYNDFVLVGPATDPAGARGTEVAEAMRLIADKNGPFVSRGDDSGTHKAELRLWKLADVDPRPDSGQWYLESGSGMGATLNTASAMNAYTLTDRGTWLAFRNRGALEILVEEKPPLHNPYGVMLVDPKRHPHVKAVDGQAFIDWLVSEEGQRAIADFRVDDRVLFWPNGSPR